MITALVCVDRNWAIGRGGSRLVVIPEDKKYLNATAAHNILVMGRRTLEGFSDYDLPSDSKKIILSRNPDYKAKNAEVAASPEEALKAAKKYEGDVYVIGGEETFNSMLEYCDNAEVTYVDYVYEADAHFPNLDKLPEWILVSESEEQTYFDTVFYYRKYTRRKGYQV